MLSGIVWDGWVCGRMEGWTFVLSSFLSFLFALSSFFPSRDEAFLPSCYRVTLYDRLETATMTYLIYQFWNDPNS